MIVGTEQVGRYCKGWPSVYDRSYHPCRGKYEELFNPPTPITDEMKHVWRCNECGSNEFTDALSEEDLEWLACTGCGGDEFTKVLVDVMLGSS